MNNLQIFQYLFDQIETPFLQSVDAMVNAFISYAAAPLQTALVLYIAADWHADDPRASGRSQRAGWSAVR